jgi:DNA helicase-2/ATP-dependent DNA helicase PcrA
MTLHASKGLEFPVVYLTAVEEGLLPHERSREHPEQLEEERRLMFVGVTRAQQELQISLARYRDFRGQRKMTIPSSFLMELPRAEMEIASPELQLGRNDESDDAESSHDFAFDETWCEEDDDGGDGASRVEAAVFRTVRLTTAAALADGGETMPAVDANVFRQGMAVRHATFGPGRIIALGGTADCRTATIDFSPPIGRKRLPLAGGLLRPLETR